ncbi:MAG: CPBP family intramembrane metalloprotease [Chitinophagaceae bacterium]|nr:CPBP family intramembrane metalloprotease [Chitinophagaceae bacterium]
MAGHSRVNSPWSQLGIFLGLFGLAFFLGYVLMAIMALSMGLADGSTPEGFDWSNPKVVSGLKLIQAISSIVIFLLPAIIFARIVSNRQPLSFLGIRPAPVKLMYALSVVGIILAFPFVFWLGEINQLIPLPQWMGDMEREAAKQMQQFLKKGSFFDVFVNVLIIAFLPAICEEVCFRGALQRVVIHITKSPWRGIILTSILFSALHLQFQGFLPRLALGIFLGAIYWYSGSLWLSILAHFVANGAQVIAVSYAPEYIEKNPPVPLYMAILSVLITIGIIWTFKTMSTTSYRNVYESEENKRNNEFLV